VVGGGITVPFLSDLGVHVRFLLALPLLIAAEVIVHQYMRPILGQLLQRGIVPPDARPRFHACVESAMRLRNSILAEVLLIAFVYTAGHQLWKQQLVLHTATWYASVVDGVLLLSPAGYWYAFVSIPIYQLDTFNIWVVLEKNNMSYPGSRAGTSSSFTRCCMSWRPRGSGCTGYQR
jgi:hypothetical protein